MLYLGGNTFIKNNEIIGIFDMDNVTVSKKTRDFLNNAEKEKNIVYTSIYDMPLSLVVTKNTTYISPIAPKTLSYRVKNRLV